MIYMFLAALCIAGFVFFIVCAAKESDTTGLYKALNVYGRIRAYLYADLLLCGIGMMALIPVIALFVNGSVTSIISYMAMCFLFGAVLLAVAFFLYIDAKKRCPVQLKGSLAKDMLISGCGVGMKLAVFFIPIVWCLSTPHFIDATDEYGRHVYIASDGTVYSAYGDSVGVMVNHGEYIRY